MKTVLSSPASCRPPISRRMPAWMSGLAAALVLAIGPSGARAACDQTVSVGANVAAAVARADAGTTVCLAPGNHGAVTLSGIRKVGVVTLQSAEARSATVSLVITQSSYLKLQGLTLNGLNMWNGANTRIAVLNNTFTGQFLVTGSPKCSAPAGILIDGNTFDGISVCPDCYEGRLQIYNGFGVTVSNNRFTGGGESDGIQMGGYGGRIGPGNVFSGLLYNGGRHVDALQLYGEVDSVTIEGNYFVNGGSYIMAPDGSIGGPTVVRHNVFVGGRDWNAVQFGGFQGVAFEHNTVIGLGVYFNDKTPSTDVSASDNVMHRSQFYGSGSITNNLFSLGYQASGTGAIVGTPQFAGGPLPNTYSGHQLLASSPGYRAATDGADLGVARRSSIVGGGRPPGIIPVMPAAAAP